MTDPESGVTSYAYDSLNRLTTLTPPSAFASGNFGFSYDALSRRTQMTRPNGVSTEYAYDNLSRLLSVLHKLSGSTIDGATYTVDAVGNRTAKVNQLPSGPTENYTYDAIYQLTQVAQAGPTTTESYTYDAVGNRTASLSVSPYSYNSSNHLTSIGSGPDATFTYDNNGNTTTKVDSSGTTTYTWDYENRLASVTLPNSGGTVSFTYDPLGRRIRKVFGSATTIYAYDGENIVEETDANGNAVARYAMGLSIDEPLAMLRSSATHYYSADGLGSVTSLTNGSGAVAASYTYDAFGNLAASSGSVVNSFRYTAREFDSETALYFYRARYYDQAAGRFLNEDLLQFNAGNNFYEYAYNNPPNFTDPSGLQPQTVFVPPPPAANPFVVIPGGAAALSGTVVRTGSVGGAIGALIAIDVLLAIHVGQGIHQLAIAYDLIEDPAVVREREATEKTLREANAQATRACKNPNKDCSPCNPPIGTLGYRMDIVPGSRPHYPFRGTHWNLYVMNQNPKTCKCFWVPIGAGSGPLPSGSVQMQ